jgi:uncharacterized membrane protein YfcA
MKNILIGIMCCAIGIYFVWHTFKSPIKDKPDPLAGNFKGYLGGILAIIIGILSLCRYIKWD